MGRKELGISSKEYNDAVILEKLFYIAKKVKCSTCMFKQPTAVDFQKLELLCDTCSSRCKTVSRIGYDDIHMRTIVELERKYKINDGKPKESNKKESDSKHKRDKHKSEKSSKKSSENRKNGNKNPSFSPISSIDSDDDTVIRNNVTNQVYDTPDKLPGMAGLMASKQQQLQYNPFNNQQQFNPNMNRATTFNGYQQPPYMDMNMNAPNTDRPYMNYPPTQQYNTHYQDHSRLSVPTEVGRMSKNPFANNTFNNSNPRYN